jgi:hypothetical protein
MGWRAIGLLAAGALLTSACHRDPPAPAAGGAGGWVVQQSPSSRLAVVYVHGIFGDAIGTWTNPAGAHFYDFVNAAPGIAGQADMFAFGFPSDVFRSGSFDIREAANRLHLRLDGEGVLAHGSIVFVAHSMGGLVVLRELLTHPEVRDRVPVVIFFGTPQEGADISRIAQHLANNPALAQMTPADGNDLLKTLSDEWNSLPAAKRPHVRCAYEKLPTRGVLIVPWSSATRFCEGSPPAIAASHIDIVKPERPDSDAVLVVTAALKEYVLNRSLAPKLETPDFRRENGALVIDLADAVGRQSARLFNTGGSSLTFTLAENSDPALFLWPDDTPRELPAGAMERMFLALGFGARATEYRFVLRSDAAPDAPVIVRVPSLAQAQAQQLAIVQAAADGIEAVLAGRDSGARLRAARSNDESAPAAVAAGARAGIAAAVPGLPDTAQWVLTAETLAAMNWPGLAVTALREAEASSPAAARAPGVRRLAAVAAALSGESRVFRGTTTPVLSQEDAAAIGDRNLLVTAGADRAMQLAARMRQVPALRALGLSLEGDAHEATGNPDAARRSFQEAATIRRSPSVSRRLGALGAAGRVAHP